MKNQIFFTSEKQQHNFHQLEDKIIYWINNCYVERELSYITPEPTTLFIKVSELKNI